MSNFIVIENLKKTFNNEIIYNNFNIKIKEKKITAIFGPNGSGKSTFLNILSGVTKNDSGNLKIKKISFNFSYIFQNYRQSLLPWKTNFENIIFPLQIQKKSQEKINVRIKELQKIFDFDFDLYKYPYELSGGQQQILAFMRALIVNPEVLFIDEPFSALDYENNLKLRDILQKYYMLYRPTIILVTHNIEEAVSLGENIIIFSKKPTSVVDTVINDSKYPRTIKFLKSYKFHKIKDHVLSIFQKTTKI